MDTIINAAGITFKALEQKNIETSVNWDKSLSCYRAHAECDKFCQRLLDRNIREPPVDFPARQC